MKINQILKKEFLSNKNNITRFNNKILDILNENSTNSYILSINEALLSKSLVKKLWRCTDGKGFYNYFDIKDNNFEVLNYFDLEQIVTLHLGWDILSYSCNLKSALLSFEKFKNIEINSFGDIYETFNLCVYPNTIDWCLIFAGHNFYPIKLNSEKPEIIKFENKLLMQPDHCN